MKKFFKKISKLTWAFIALFAVFFIVGVSTLGCARTTGDSFILQARKTAYFTLTVESGEKLDGVYAKVDNFYAAEGDVTVTVNTSTTSSPTTSSWNSSNALSTVIVGADGGADIKYAKTQNWIALGTDLARTAKSISITASASVEIKEIVCLNEQGERIAIKGYRPSSGSNLIAASELTPAYDAQKSFTASENSYYNFTAEEAYYLNSVKNLMAGNKYVSGGKYVVGENFNYLATVLLVPSVAMFGDSVFALRLPAFLATCATIIFAYMFARAFFKNEKHSFIFAVLLCVGGMVTSVGRMAAPYALVASALVASGYFMYRFFAKGISSKRVYRDGLNILLSGIFAAFAMAMDTAAAFPVLGILVLFGFGLRRQKLDYQLALKKTEGKEETVKNEQGEKVTVNKAERAVKGKYLEKQRVAWCYAVLSFVLTSVVLILFAAILCYPAAIRANGNVDVGFIKHVLKGGWHALRGGAAVPFGEANASNVWAWLLPIKSATIYTGVNGVAANNHLVWNVMPNLVINGLSFLALLGVTVKVAIDVAKGNKDKKALRLRRRYFILLGGLAAAMLGGCLKLYVSPIYSFFFHVIYTAFLPLAATLIPEEGLCKTKGKLLEVLIWVIVGGSAAFFFITLPSTWGIVVADGYARIMRFLCLINNGHLRSLR
ncbi:MAG: glycosyltransferase family 39 protein [Clostridia bacterium]|nr:glycosyltransferase family 39 protein [Clostridia bacterium]